MDSHCTPGVGHIFRYHPALVALEWRIDRRELGPIKYLQTRRFSFRVPRTATGVLYSLAVHDVDVYDYLLGTARHRPWTTGPVRPREHCGDGDHHAGVR